MRPCQGHTASHDPAMASNHSAGHVHGERHVGHTHRPPPNTLSPHGAKTPHTPPRVCRSHGPGSLPCPRACTHPPTQAETQCGRQLTGGVGIGLGVAEGLGQQKLHRPLLLVRQILCVAHSLQPLNVMPPCPGCVLIPDEDVGQCPLREIGEGHPEVLWFYFPRLEAQPHLQCPNPLVGHDPLPVQRLVTLGGGGESPRVKGFCMLPPRFPKPLPHHPQPPPPP